MVSHNTLQNKKTKNNREIQPKENKKHDRHQHNTDEGGQAMGEGLIHVQMSR